MTDRVIGAGTAGPSAHSRKIEGIAKGLTAWPAVVAGAILGLLLQPHGALAQDPRLPSQVTPGQIERQFEEEPTPRTEIDPPPSIEFAPQTAPPGSEEVRFVLQDVVFQGATVFDAEDFRPFYAELIGQEISLAQMYDIARQATVLYRQEGYILSLVIVPPQTIEGGVVQLQVIEGFIDSVIIEGDAGGSPERVQAIADQIARERPLTAATLERYLLIIGDLAGIDARAVLQASPTTPGASMLSIVLEYDPVSGFANLSNRSSRFVGPVRPTAGITLNSPFGFYEEISFLYATATETSELQFGQASVLVPVGNHGSTVALTVSRSFSEPGFVLEPTETQSESLRANLRFDHPIIRSREATWTAGAEFDYFDSEIEVLDTVTSEDSLRVLRIDTTYDAVDRLLGTAMPAVSLLRLRINQGLPILGASEEGDTLLTDLTADGVFTSFNFDVQRDQRLFDNVSAFAAATAQVATEALLSSEQFGLGGASFGRGYDPSEATGDNGYGTSAELRYSDTVDWTYVDDYQVYVFHDYGQVFNLESTEEDEIIHSVGGGIRMNIAEHVSLNLEGARQLSEISASSGDGERETRVLFSLTARF